MVPGAAEIESKTMVPFAVEPVELNDQRWVTDCAFEKAVERTLEKSQRVLIRVIGRNGSVVAKLRSPSQPVNQLRAPQLGGNQNVFLRCEGRMLNCSRYLATVRRATLMPCLSSAFIRNSSDNGLPGFSVATSCWIASRTPALETSVPSLV